jgi:hypothetical protein
VLVDRPERNLHRNGVGKGEDADHPKEFGRKIDEEGRKLEAETMRSRAKKKVTAEDINKVLCNVGRHWDLHIGEK